MNTKKQLRRATLLILILVLAILAYPFASGKSLQSATEDRVVAQVPYVLDILAARYPIRIGFLRSTLNGDGAVDHFAEQYVRTSMDQANAGLVALYVTYYYATFDQDDLRKTMADSLEKRLGLV